MAEQTRLDVKGWPAAKVEMWAVEDLSPYAKNARLHSEEQVEQIAASMERFGFTIPVLVAEDGTIIAGHGRIMAAKRLGLSEVPVMVARGWSDEDRRVYTLADNRLAETSDWDVALLAQELDALSELGEGDGLAAVGLSHDALAGLLKSALIEAEAGLTDPDAVPEIEPDAPTVTRPGDIWLLGAHRVMCGDSTSADDLAALMNGDLAELLHADPPYGMGKAGQGVANDNKYRDQLDAFQRDWWAAVHAHMAPLSSAYVWGWEHNLCLFYVSILLPMLAASQATHKNWIVWDKKSGQGMRQDGGRRYAATTEHCLFFACGHSEDHANADNYWEGWEPIRAAFAAAVAKQGWSASDLNRLTGTHMGKHWVGKSQWAMITRAHFETLREGAAQPEAFGSYAELRAAYDELRPAFDARRAYFDNAHDTMRDVWDFSRVTGADRHGHATPKPVAMMERVMRSSLPEGGLCLEPFGGSGSTLMGAERSGRRCFTMELQARYCDVIVRRWQDYTGQEAALEETGQTFAQLERERPVDGA